MHLAPPTLLLDDISAWKRVLSPFAPRPAGLPIDRRGPPNREIEESRDFVPGEDDAVWIERVQGGDEDAARAMVRRLYPTIVKSVRYHLPKRTGEEDLVQAVFMKIFKNLGQYSGLVPLEHWVSRIAINTCINQLKHERVRPELRMSDLSEEAEAVVEHLASSEEGLPNEQSAAAREVVELLLARLKPEEQLVLRLVHLEERSVAEISRRTGWSISLVKVRAFRARKRMRAVWQELFEGEEV